MRQVRETVKAVSQTAHLRLPTLQVSVSLVEIARCNTHIHAFYFLFYVRLDKCNISNIIGHLLGICVVRLREFTTRLLHKIN